MPALPCARGSVGIPTWPHLAISAISRPQSRRSTGRTVGIITIIPPGVAAYTGMLADPCRPTSLFTWCRFPSDPRGTPKPAESFSNTKFPSLSGLDITIGLSFAITSEDLVAPDVGGCGMAGRVGECIVLLSIPFTGIPPPPVGIFPVIMVPFVILFNPLNPPPGCQPHP